MAITLSGSTIVIDSGLAAGTATGGTATTLTGSGFSTAWADRIIYLTGGTGAGQSRPIRSATTTVITIADAWDVTPDATTTFKISYDVRDIVTALPASASHVGLARQKIIQTAAFIQVVNGGVFGGLDNFIIFTSNNTYLHSAVGGFIQFGRNISDQYGVNGGGIFYNLDDTLYADYTLAGVSGFYGTKFSVAPESATGTSLMRILQTGDPQSAKFIDCLFENLVVLEGVNCTFVNNRFIGGFSGFFTKNNPDLNTGSEVFSGVLSIRTSEGNPNGSDTFDLTYLPPNPTTGLFTVPIFCFNYKLPDGVHYYWNTTFPAGLANSVRWFGDFGDGLFYEGYSVAPDILDLEGDPIADVTLALIDKDGNAGWTVSKDASFNPVKQTILKTNASGTVTNSAIGTGEKALVTRSLWSRLSEYVSQAINYYPFTLKVRKYGYVYLSEAADFTERTVLTKFLSPDENITETDGATVAAYTTLETSAKFYDYCRYFESLDANIGVNLLITRSGTLIDAGSYNVTIDATAASVFAFDGTTITIKASTYTGDMTTTGIITLANGATFIGTRTDANGTVAPPQTFTISGITSGSRLRVYNATTATEIVNQVVSGTSYVGEYSEGGDFSEGDSVNVRLTYVDGTTAKQEFPANAIAGASGWSLLVEQIDNDVYNSFGIDGSTITQFQADYLTDQVDVVVGANFNLSSFYAWWVYNLTTEDGIRDFFGGITAEDQANFRINTAVLSLFLDNSTNTNIRQLDNRRFYRSDGAYPVLDPTSGGGGIDIVWRNQIFIAEVIVNAGTTPVTEVNGASVTRSDGDQTPILFTFPTPNIASGEFVKTRRINGGTSEPIAGTVTYLYEISGKYWYRLAYDASDRPSGDGTVQYVFTNSGKTAVINLHVSETLDSTEAQAAAAAALNAYDAPTKAELDSAVANLSTFDPTTDVVITDTESREASKADLSGIEDNLHTINEGVKKASLLIPHTEDI